MRTLQRLKAQESRSSRLADYSKTSALRVTGTAGLEKVKTVPKIPGQEPPNDLHSTLLL